MSGVVERLRAKRQVMPVQGGGSLSSDGKASSYITDDGMRLINPDGLEAADEIARLRSENETLRDALEPFALLAADESTPGANMKDPLSKWFTVAHLQAARTALRSPLVEGEGPNHSARNDDLREIGEI